ncbi:MAG: Hsp20/alpha crystallin family protein [Chitinophagaceae bacterium]|nr:Hsp20/alpha crystallin family protein [Chitinophagaceae bacterium]MBK8953018.1 Hsp20/alpha crystallin family protein [Chitinophagaceae bacterium]
MKQIQGTRTDNHTIVSLNDKNGEYVLYVVMPGIRRSELEVNIRNRQLTVTAVRNEALHSIFEPAKPVINTWKESFRLPSDADTLMTAAVFYKGELEIHIPKGQGKSENHTQRVYVY